MSKLALRSQRVLFPDGKFAPATVYVENGIITEVSSNQTGVALDVGDSVIMPGIIDTHAHINEPGRTEWEGFQTATRAAAAGGITTVIDMPLNSIPATTTLAAFYEKKAAAAEQCSINYGFWGGVIPGNSGELGQMIEAGVFGFKCFLIESGVDEFPMSKKTDLEKAMPILARAGVPLLVHAELESKAPLEVNEEYSSYLASRPEKWEIDAIELVAELCQKFQCPTHIVHLSAASALNTIKKFRATGAPLTVETCPHYLAFEAEKIPDGATLYKCSPPIREARNREKLWEGLRTGEIDLVVSDHSPCTPQLKRGHFGEAWGGIAGLQLSFPTVWTEARARGFKINEIAHWMSAAPARFLGLEKSKGRIQKGYDADLIVWNPEASFTVKPEWIRHRHKPTPYEGRKLFGVVEKTFVSGRCVYDSGELPTARVGKLLLRGKR